MGGGYEAIIGLECHAQLRTASKMFCACAVASERELAPNTAICEICMAHPGTLPALNAAAVALGVRAAVAISCTVHPTSVFSRKNYFYPDLPKGYQISQFDRPLATGGRIRAGGKEFGITRVHLEEDAGKMMHTPEGSVVDWNRAGVPLIEIVSEPDMRTAEEAEAYLRTLHRVLVDGGICLGDMEKGHFRCDANVSIHRAGEPFGVKVEIKNVNSFRFVAKAIRFEIDRQTAVVQAGGTIAQETRTWAGTRTVALRGKEGSADYRFFPEPDLPPLRVGPAQIAAEAARLPGVPMDLHLEAADAARLVRWRQLYGLPAYDVGVLTADPDVAAFFVACVDAGGDARTMCNWLQTDLIHGELRPEHLVRVQAMMDAGAINRDGAKALLEALVQRGGDPDALAEALGLRQVSDEDALRAIVAALLAEFPVERERYRTGNKGMLGFFMGRLMMATNRQADTKLGNRLLREALDQGALT